MSKPFKVKKTKKGATFTAYLTNIMAQGDPLSRNIALIEMGFSFRGTWEDYKALEDAMLLGERGPPPSPHYKN